MFFSTSGFDMMVRCIGWEIRWWGILSAAGVETVGGGYMLPDQGNRQTFLVMPWPVYRVLDPRIWRTLSKETVNGNDACSMPVFCKLGSALWH